MQKCSMKIPVSKTQEKILEMGLEPMTLGLLDLRSNRLSYTSSCDDVSRKML